MFEAIINQLLILYIFITIGFIIGKIISKKNVNSQILSILLVKVFLPCKVFISLSKNFTIERVKQNLLLLAVAIVLLVVLVQGIIVQPMKFMPFCTLFQTQACQLRYQ